MKKREVNKFAFKFQFFILFVAAIAPSDCLISLK